jgi:hypothetical protein
MDVNLARSIQRSSSWGLASILGGWVGGPRHQSKAELQGGGSKPSAGERCSNLDGLEHTVSPIRLPMLPMVGTLNFAKTWPLVEVKSQRRNKAEGVDWQV